VNAAQLIRSLQQASIRTAKGQIAETVASQQGIESRAYLYGCSRSLQSIRDAKEGLIIGLQ
jgi:hypothetical protein